MTEFTHLRLLDPAWKPGPGQRYADAPKARCRVTRKTATTVYYRYADGSPGVASMTRETWDQDYAPTIERTTAMPNTLTDAQVDAAILAWGDTPDSRAVANIIIETSLRESVVDSYLEWLSPTMARPDLRQLLKDEQTGKTYLSSTAYFLATLAANIRGGGTVPVDLRKLWSLDPVNRAAVVRSLAKALGVYSLS